MTKKDYSKKANELKKQVNAIARHIRTNSFGTRRKYYFSMVKFTRFLADNFGIQKIANIQDKHIHAYVKEMNERNLAPSTIKNELAGIRFYHDHMANTRYEISDNEAFDIESRDTIGSNKAWTDEEYEKIQSIKVTDNVYHTRNVVRDVTGLARSIGLRVEEALRLDTSNARNGLKEGTLRVKGKGGKIRYVPLNDEARAILRSRLGTVELGQKLFVDKDDKTHLVKGRIQNFINKNREEFQDSVGRVRMNEDGMNVTNSISIHGLRHKYAREQYETFKEKGYTDKQARLKTAQLLGHERDDVTRIYISESER